MTPILSVRDLSVRFGDGPGTVTAVDRVSFDLAPGETLALVGESGCGKTLTALSILRLLPEAARTEPQSRVLFSDADLLTIPAARLRRVRGGEIAMVFQEPTTSLNPVLTVGAQIVEAIRAHRNVSKPDARARAVELLRLVGIPDAASRVDAYPHQMSGGMQQRVMIAMALSCEPKILIADEPTTALDVTVQADILDLLRDLRQRFGMALLLISHDLAIVAGMADRIAVMYAGQLVEVATADRLFRSPAHPYTEALLAAVPRVERPVRRLAAIPGSVPLPGSWPPACRFQPRCPYAWDRCRADAPGVFDARPGQVARCWLIEEPHRRGR